MGRGDVMKNPYRPGAALTPSFLAGRDRERRRFAAILRSAPEIPANIRLTGLRGVGKTVLLKQLESDAEEGLGWSTSRVQIEPRHNTNDALVTLLSERAKQTGERLSRKVRLRAAVRDVAVAARGALSVSIEDIHFQLEPGDTRQRDLVTALFHTVEVAMKSGRDGHMLMLDEAQLLRDDRDRNGQHPLSLLVAAVNSMQEHAVPIGLILCGLPTLRTNLLKARTYSERMFRGEEIGSLGPDQARDAFTRPLEGTNVTADSDLVDRVIEEVEGYPFFIQLWGAELWDAASDAGTERFSVRLLDEVEPDIYRRLDRDFYDGRVEALSPAEADLLVSTARCPYPPLRTADIQNQSEKREANVNVLMGRLTEQGVVFRIQKGQYEYTAPKFHGYLQRRTGRKPTGR
ncbi:MAG: ATP-binding protein [Candidatus Nanopelagicales bacterium]|nr:ATP-binding protein [Candidatus Nanopelagicales bacterium]